MRTVVSTVNRYTINWLLLASPVGFAINYLHGGAAGATFALNFIALIPIAGITIFAAEEIMLRFGKSFGGLIFVTVR
jgi:hypothetical protein